jgi:bifunctional enzyme CysN/CysC
MQSSNKNKSGVIWITGFSAAGKTSLARIVAHLLVNSDVPTIHLDGDDLRGIFGNKWGYTGKDRRELAKVYFRLCSLIAAQGKTVVISAVAMYEEVFTWFKQNVPGGLIVYLNVPEETRRERDAITKKFLYSSETRPEGEYDTPASADLILNNDRGTDLHKLAETIAAQFRDVLGKAADRGKSSFWESFYSKRTGVLHPSPFALFVSDLLGPDGRGKDLLEVGCGNGRDSAFFSQNGFRVTAIDASSAAIDYCREVHGGSILFEHRLLSAPDSQTNHTYDVVYSRFVLHAMTPEEGDEFLVAAARCLKPNGRLLLECRSINDPLARKGEVLSPTERIDGHYRRFIVADELLEDVKAVGLAVEQLVESAGLAKFKDEDPVVIRLIAKKAT